MNISYYAYPGIPLSERRPLTITDEYIIKVVCEHYGFTREMLNKRTRRFEIVRARFVCWMLIKRHIKRYGLERMGNLFGLAHHTTVHHGVKALAGHCESDEGLRRDIAAISRRIENLN